MRRKILKNTQGERRISGGGNPPPKKKGGGVGQFHTQLLLSKVLMSAHKHFHKQSGCGKLVPLTVDGVLESDVLGALSPV